MAKMERPVEIIEPTQADRELADQAFNEASLVADDATCVEIIAHTIATARAEGKTTERKRCVKIASNTRSLPFTDTDLIEALREAFTTGANWAAEQERAVVNGKPLGLSELETFEEMLALGASAISKCRKQLNQSMDKAENWRRLSREFEGWMHSGEIANP